MPGEPKELPGVPLLTGGIDGLGMSEVGIHLWIFDLDIRLGMEPLAVSSGHPNRSHHSRSAWRANRLTRSQQIMTYTYLRYHEDYKFEFLDLPAAKFKVNATSLGAGSPRTTT